jgi:hypothetical protein
MMRSDLCFLGINLRLLYIVFMFLIPRGSFVTRMIQELVCSRCYSNEFDLRNLESDLDSESARGKSTGITSVLEY